MDEKSRRRERCCTRRFRHCAMPTQSSKDARGVCPPLLLRKFSSRRTPYAVSCGASTRLSRKNLTHSEINKHTRLSQSLIDLVRSSNAGCSGNVSARLQFYRMASSLPPSAVIADVQTRIVSRITVRISVGRSVGIRVSIWRRRIRTNVPSRPSRLATRSIILRRDWLDRHLAVNGGNSERSFHPKGEQRFRRDDRWSPSR